MFVLIAIHTVPIWEDHGELRVAGINEVRKDLAVMGWAEIMDVELYGERRQFLVVW